MKKIILQIFGLVISIVAIFNTASIVLAEWTLPDSAAPQGNVAAPLTVSPNIQYKQGSLSIAGEFLHLSTGDFIFNEATDGAGIFWNDLSASEKAHIDYAIDPATLEKILYLTSGEAGDHTEIQGNMSITKAGDNQGSLTLGDPDNNALIFTNETGNDIELLSASTPLHLNMVGAQDVRLGSAAERTNLCLNDPGDRSECIEDWIKYWTVTDPNLYPSDSTWNTAIGIYDANSYKLNVAGDINIPNPNNFYYAGTSGASIDCGNDQQLKEASVMGGLIVSGTCASDFGSQGNHWNYTNPNKLYYDAVGHKVGLGTDEPLAKLHVSGGSVLFNDPNGLPSITDDGPRFGHFHSAGGDESFRSGYFTAAIWPDNQKNKLAIGYNPQTSGRASVSIGINSLIDENYSTTVGKDNTSHAEYSFVTGNNNSLGELVGAYSKNIVFGEDIISTHGPSLATGKGVTVTDVNSLTTGLNTTTEYCAKAFGDNTWASVGSFVAGKDTIASGLNSFASGDTNTANGRESIVAGTDSLAQGIYSVSMGSGNETRNFGVALGYHAFANHTAFVFADTSSEDIYASPVNESFAVRAEGGVWYADVQQWDIAEAMDVYKKDNVQPGELVSLSGNDSLEKTKTANDNNLIGVVTSERTNTLHLEVLGQPDNPELERQYITLVGRVYVKVNNSGGAIVVGDPIASSSIPGIGMKANQPSKILGYAMEEADFSQGSQTEVLVFVNVESYVPENVWKEQQNKINDLKQKFADFRDILE